MLKHAALALVLTVILSCEQNTPLIQYEPKSSQEQALKSVLPAFQDGLLNKVCKKVENLILEKAAIMIGHDRKILSKAAYAGILPQRLADNSQIALGQPRMTVSGEKADIKIYMSRGGGSFLMNFPMTLENNQWYILSWVY